MAVVIISALFLSSQHLTEVDQMFLNSGSQNSLNLQQVNKISMKGFFNKHQQQWKKIFLNLCCWNFLVNSKTTLWQAVCQTQKWMETQNVVF